MINKKNMYLITVIVPVYNVDSYLDRCVKSILDQTYNRLEIILVDDGSTDNSGKICDKYAQIDKRVKVIHKENGGLVTARKTGLVYARGDYIGFVDSDDYIDSDFYELLLKNIVDNESDISQMGYLMEYDDMSKNICCLRKVFDIKEHRTELLCEGFLELSKQDFCISYNVWSKLYNAELLKFCYFKVPDTQQYGEDVMCLCYCMLYCNKISTIDFEKYHYIIRNDSISNERSLDYFVKVSNLYMQLINVFQNHTEYLRIKDSIDIFYREHILRGLNMFGVVINRYAFPKIDILKNKNIILYGAGGVGRDYYTQICQYRLCNIIAVMDKNYNRYHYDYIDVVGKDKLSSLEYDLILISVLKEELALSIRLDLIGEGVLEEDIIWEKPTCYF